MTITIEDTLPKIVESACYDIKAELEAYLKDNEPDYCPDWSDLDHSGRMHEIIDGSVPVYTGEQKDLWYIHGDEAEELFESQFGAESKTSEGWPMSWQAAALYCLIEDRCLDWWNNNANDIFDAWEETKQ